MPALAFSGVINQSKSVFVEAGTDKTGSLLILSASLREMPVVISGPFPAYPAWMVSGLADLYSMVGVIHNALSPLAPSSVGSTDNSSIRMPFKSISMDRGDSLPCKMPLL